MAWSKYNKRSKFGSQKATSNTYTELAGRRFDSKLERDRAEHLVMMLRDGQIHDLQFQVTLYLTRARIGYRPDFVYMEDYAGGQRKVWEDAKGFETEKWRIVKKLWADYGPGLLRITMRSGSRIVTVKEIYGRGEDISD